MRKNKMQKISILVLILILSVGTYFLWNNNSNNVAKKGVNTIEFELDKMELNMSSFIKSKEDLEELRVDSDFIILAKHQRLDDESFEFVQNEKDEFIFKPKFLAHYTLVLKDETTVNVNVVDTRAPVLMNAEKISVKTDTSLDQILLYFEFYDYFDIKEINVVNKENLDLSTVGTKTLKLEVSDINDNVLKQDVDIELID